MNANRDNLKAKKPDLKFGELTKELTDQWKSLSEKDKKEWEDKAAAEKDRYNKEMQEAGLLKNKPEKDGPKRPQSAFFLFQADARERIKKENPDIKQTELLKKTGAEWRDLDEKKKAVYEKKAAALKD